MSKAKYLRDLLNADEPLLMPGVWDAFTARLAEVAGFEAMFMTGHGVSISRLGLPDLGFSGLETVVDAARAIGRGTDRPFIVDADTGYGDAISVIHTVREVEGAGAAGILLEDQVWPKKCGHFEGKRLIPAGEMVGKLRAAVEARRDADFVIVARTDSIATEGIRGAVRRLGLYRDAGADVLFADAIETRDQMQQLSSLGATTMVNIVEGGKTPLLSTKELSEMGFRIILYAGTGMFATMKTLSDVWRVLRADRDTLRIRNDLAGFDEFKNLMRLPEWEARSAEFAPSPQSASVREAGKVEQTG